MAFDLNFWPEPDWQRESSVDPYFLLLLFLALLLSACVGAAAWGALAIQSRRGDLLRIEIAIGKMRRDAQEVQRQIDCVTLWEQNRRRLESGADSRFVWCRQLAAIQALVPESVTLTRLAVDSTEVRADLAPAEPGSAEGGSRPAGRASRDSTVTRFVMTLAGVARGDNPETIITEFSRAIPAHPELRPLLSTVELTSVVTESRVGAGETPGKEFVVLCRYKPVVLEHANP
jgi:Tfp pilus assembly protein PilN